MNVKYPLLMAALLNFCHSFSQCNDWVWGRDENYGQGEGWAIATDRGGNAYLAGWRGGGATFGTYTLPGTGFCVVKYDGSGNVLWARGPIDTTDESLGLGVATDIFNNVFVTGSITGDSMVVGGITLYNPSHGSIFIVSYDSLGNFRWAKNFGGYWNDAGNALAVDAGGNVYITGEIDDSVHFGNSYIGSAGSENSFVAKYDNAGNELWAKSPLTSYSVGYGVATDGLGNVFVTGIYQGDTARFGNMVLSSGIAGSNNNIYIVKYNSSGTEQWGRIGITSFSFTNYNQSWGATTDKSDNVYITGSFNTDTLTFGSRVILNTTPGINAYDFFLTKYDGAGNLVWAQSAGNGTVIQGFGLATDADNNLFVSGGFTGTSFSLGDSTFTVSASATDPMFVFKMDSLGNMLCTATLPSGGDDVNAIAVDPHGDVYAGGDFEMNGMVLGPDTLNAQRGEVLFIGNLVNGTITQCTLGAVTITADTTTICASDSAYICAPAGFASYFWNTGQTTPCFYTNLAGNYYVAVTDNNGCTATSNRVALTVHTPPQISITVNGDTLTVNNGSNIQWYQNGNPIPGGTSNQIIGSKGSNYTVQVSDTNGCTILSNPVNLSGINSLIENMLTIYPNPTNTGWQLAVGNELVGSEMQIWDSQGLAVFQSVISTQKLAINLPLSKGIYILRISTKEGLLVRKLVKM